MIAPWGHSAMIILNFHGVGPLLREVDHGERECWLDAEHFKAVIDRVGGDARVRLTFDDGNASDFGIVLPILLSRGLRAEFFVCSGLLGEPTFMTSGQVRGLLAAGMAVGSHGVEHLSWRKLADEELDRELRGSRETLEELTGHPVKTAACPFGAYDRRVLKRLAAAGYSTVFTSDGGPCPGGWLRARNTVKRSTTPEQIERMLARSASPAWRLSSAARTTMKRLRLGRPG